MTEHSGSLIREFLETRATVGQLLLVALLLALGVNLLAGGLPTFFGWPPVASILVGSVLCALAFAVLVSPLLNLTTRTHRYSGFFLYDRERNALLDVPRYRFAEHIYFSLQQQLLKIEISD